MNKILGRSACAAMLIVACGGDGSGKDNPPEQPVGRNDAPLRALEGCDELAEVIRQNALVEMNKRVDQAEKSYFASRGGCYGDGDGDGYDYADAGDSGDGDGDGGGSGAIPPPTDVSGTNNQVATVDEADMVKTDSKYLYVTSNGALHIL